MARSTHTRELEQIGELNASLAAENGHHSLTADALGLANSTMDALAGLRQVIATGSPSYPYLFGLFASRGSDGHTQVPLHTGHLRTLSETLHLRHHRWGI
jgi:hypothetical protein